jgi:hypothetical protein
LFGAHNSYLAYAILAGFLGSSVEMLFVPWVPSSSARGVKQFTFFNVFFGSCRKLMVSLMEIREETLFFEK